MILLLAKRLNFKLIGQAIETSSRLQASRERNSLLGEGGEGARERGSEGARERGSVGAWERAGGRAGGVGSVVDKN
jgi:hypothetical protein